MYPEVYPGPLFYLLIHWFVSAAALVVTAYVVPGFRVKSFGSALLAAAVLAMINMTIRPLLLFLALPFTILTLGFFIFVVDAALLKLSSALLKNFKVDSWFAAILGALVLWVVGGLFHYLVI